MIWNDYFLTLFDSCCATYRTGVRDLSRFYSGEDLAFLSTIGYKPREFFDFVEDFCDDGEPSASTSLLVAAARRDYFLTIQKGVTSRKTVMVHDLPSFGDVYDGIPYLPRVLAKARAKLRGELDEDVMVCCGGDRKFRRTHGNIHPADFLRHVWASRGNDAKVVAWLRSRAG